MECPAWHVEFATEGQRSIERGEPTVVHSRVWAGYVVDDPGEMISEVRGSWTQPAIPCPDRTRRLSSYWIGIDCRKTETVEQVGTEANCINGRAVYAAWYEMFPGPSISIPLRARPGDRFSATISATGRRFILALVNQTTGENFSTVQQGVATERRGAEWIAEASSICPAGPPSCEPQVLPDFGRVRFSDASASTTGLDLVPLDDPAWELSKLVMVTKRGRVKAETSTLSGDGRSFTVTWRRLP